MGDLSEHFDRSEFTCKCGCGQDTVDAELIKVLEDLREYWGHPITINSANRCISHNKFVGGSEKSQHLIGKAADIKIEGFSPWLVYAHLLETYPDKYGIGRYGTFVHIDVRSTKARW